MLASLAVAAVLAASPDPTADLASARECWTARDASSYSYRIELRCFCQAPKATTVRVKHGKPRATPAALRPYDTVEELFALIDGWLKTAGPLSIAYAPHTGVPTSIVVDQNNRALDDEIGIKITRIRAPRG
jgi:hypothetical protein